MYVQVREILCTLKANYLWKGVIDMCSLCWYVCVCWCERMELIVWRNVGAVCLADLLHKSITEKRKCITAAILNKRRCTTKTKNRDGIERKKCTTRPSEKFFNLFSMNRITITAMGLGTMCDVHKSPLVFFHSVEQHIHTSNAPTNAENIETEGTTTALRVW